jgi:hypothetical protein
MSERNSSRWLHFLLMLPFFLIGVAIPVYFYGFSGDGPPQVQSTGAYETAPSAAPEAYAARRFEPAPEDGVVSFTRGLFDRAVDTYVSPNVSPLLIKLGLLAALFAAGFVAVRIALAMIAGALGGVAHFLIHKAAGPMFMGFLAVGSSWGIHQTVAQQFGMTWAAATVSMTAAVATLLALAGVRIRG